MKRTAQYEAEQESRNQDWLNRATRCHVKIDTTEDDESVMRVDFCTNDWAAAVECDKRNEGVINNIGGTYQVVFTEVWDAYTFHSSSLCCRT